eukprot:451461-Prorocentrum_minimum.AAC.3
MGVTALFDNGCPTITNLLQIFVRQCDTSVTPKLVLCVGASQYQSSIEAKRKCITRSTAHCYHGREERAHLSVAPAPHKTPPEAQLHAPERLSQLLRAEAMTMASRDTRGYSVNDMLELWDTPNLNTVKISAKFVYEELPIRYAVRTKELEMAQPWMKTKDFMEVLELYAQSFEDLRMLPDPLDTAGLEEFQALLKTIKIRNANVVPKLGKVVAEVCHRTTRKSVP